MKTITAVIGLAIFVLVAFSYLAWVGSQLGAQLRIPGVQLSYVPLMAYMTPSGGLCYDTGNSSCFNIFRARRGRLVAFLSRTQIPNTPSTQVYACYDQEHMNSGRVRNTFVTEGTKCPKGMAMSPLGYVINETSDPALPTLRACEIDGRTFLAVNHECGGTVLGHTPISGLELVQAYDLCGKGIVGGDDPDFEHRRGQLHSAGWCSSRWQNYPMPWDVNRDGSVNEEDIAAVQAALSSGGERDLPTAAGEIAPPPYIDVNGDQRLTTEDIAALTDGVVPDDTQTTPPSSDSWQNSNNRFDVNNDGNVNSFDVLQVMSYLNQKGEGELPTPTADNTPPPYVDVNGDGSATRADAEAIQTELSGGSKNRWHNATLPADANNDGVVNASDMLVVFRELQNGGAKRNDQLDTAGRTPPPYFDTTNDGQVNSNDVDFILRTMKEISSSVR